MSEWNAVLYDSKHDFVAEYGKGLLEFVSENKNQSILDLGCGTGTLTVQLSNFADIVIGVDSSASMIAKAKKQYSNMQFVVCDALALPFEKRFDVVFSNAVFHWIADYDALLKQIHKVSKPNGRSLPKESRTAIPLRGKDSESRITIIIGSVARRKSL